MSDVFVHPAVSFAERLRAHLAIARLDHSIKNLFVLPGVIVPLSVEPELFNAHLVVKLCGMELLRLRSENFLSALKSPEPR